MDSSNGRPQRRAAVNCCELTDDSENKSDCLESDNHSVCSDELEENLTTKKKSTPGTEQVKRKRQPLLARIEKNQHE